LDDFHTLFRIAGIMTLKDALDYEVSSSWWSGLVGLIAPEAVCQLAAAYFAWKTLRKWTAYQAVLRYRRDCGLALPDR